MSWKVLYFLVSVALISVLFFGARRVERKLKRNRMFGLSKYRFVNRFEIASNQLVTFLLMFAIWYIQMIVLTKSGGTVDKTTVFLFYMSPAAYLAVWTYYCTTGQIETDMRRIVSYAAIALLVSSSYFDQVGIWMLSRLQGNPPQGSEQWYCTMIAALFLAFDRILKLIQDDRARFENEKKNREKEKDSLKEVAASSEKK